MNEQLPLSRGNSITQRVVLAPEKNVEPTASSRQRLGSMPEKREGRTSPDWRRSQSESHRSGPPA